MHVGDVIVLENTRFYSEEEALADTKLEKMAKTHIVSRLAPHADFFVLDAFAAAHRAQPSLVGFCEVLPSLAGRVMERELTMLSRAIQEPERPKIALLGGVKADDSIAVARHMLENDVVDSVLTSGGVANLFLDAAGIDPGKPTTDFMRREVEDYDAHRAMCEELLARFPGRILRPMDVVLNDDGVRKPVPVSDLPAKWPVYDIGLDTIAHYVDEIRRAKTIFVNGPAGVFELEPFSVGTRELLTAVAEADGFSIVGGGHTVAAVEQFGLADRIDHEHRRRSPHQFPRGERTPARHGAQTFVQEVRGDQEIGRSPAAREPDIYAEALASPWSVCAGRRSGVSTPCRRRCGSCEPSTCSCCGRALASGSSSSLRGRSSSALAASDSA